jgi:succinoglycan biosynthesis transport protein ExoP
MTLQQFLSILRARIGLVLTVFLVTVSAATLTALILPKAYTATTSLIIDASRPDPLTGASNATNNQVQTALATQIGVIKSERVALDVVRDLRLNERLDLREKWTSIAHANTSFETWLARGLLKGMDATPTRDSSVINIDVEGADPIDVANIANAFGQAYLALSIKLRTDPARQYVTFFEGQAAELRTRVTAAQDRLSAFQRDKGVVVTDDRLDVELSRMGELSTKVLQAKADTAGAPDTPTLAAESTLPSSLTPAAIDSLRADVTHAEAQLQDYSTRWGDNHPQVLQTRAALASLRARLVTELQHAANNAMASSVLQQQQLHGARDALVAQRSRVVQLKSLREEGLVLLRDVENAQRAYDQVQSRLSQSTLESHATLGNAFVLTAATPPQNPSSPRALINIGLAGVVGLALALAAAILLEMVDPRIRAHESTVALLGQPLLGVLPPPGAQGAFAPRRIPLVGGSPHPSPKSTRKGQSWA